MNELEKISPCIQYSIVIPVFNEEVCLPGLIDRIEKSFLPLEESFEIICVDDGSKDATWDILVKLNKTRHYLKGIRFVRNFGHQLALHAGLKACHGQYIAIIDADGQDPPEILPQMFAKCQEGFDVVYGVRQKRKEHFLKKVAYKLFYRFYKFVVPFEVPLDSGDFAVLNRSVCDFLKSLTEKKPFLRGLRSWRGGKQFAFEYERQSRMAGETKYPLKKLILLAVNGLISFSRIPLRSISLLGIFTAIGAFFCGIAIIAIKIFVKINLLGWASTSVLIIFFGGLHLFVLGVIGEYIGDIFDEVKNRPAFLIDTEIGF